MDIAHWQEVIVKWRGADITVIEVELLREWSQSRVLRIKAQVNSKDYVIFAKQAHVGLDTEIAIYSLAGRVRVFPAPEGTCVNVDGTEWLILKEADGTRLAKSAPSNYRKAAEFLASFHELASLEGWSKTASLTHDLNDHVARLLGHIAEDLKQTVQSGQFTCVDLELVEAVQHAVVRQGPELIRRLSLLPTTLVHGDCHSGNIFLTDDGIQLVDWGSAIVAPGLLDIVGLVDVAERMNERAGDIEGIISAYWLQLSSGTRSAYGNFEEAWRVLRIIRALLELEWFTKTEDDYGSRANRELSIICRCLSATLIE